MAEVCSTYRTSTIPKISVVMPICKTCKDDKGISAFQTYIAQIYLKLDGTVSGGKPCTRKSCMSCCNKMYTKKWIANNKDLWTEYVRNYWTVNMENLSDSYIRHQIRSFSRGKIKKVDITQELLNTVRSYYEIKRQVEAKA